VEFQILGRTRLRTDAGEEVPLGAAKQRALLALLLYHARQPVPIDLIVDRLWNDQHPERHREQLYVLASRIRRVFRSHGLPAALVTIPGSDQYRLDVASEHIDYHRFRNTVGRAREAARTGSHQMASELLLEALALWNEPPLADLHSDGAEHDRYHLRERVWLDACKSLFDSQLALGEYEAVISRLAPLLETRPLDETLVTQWIQALDRSGRFAEAKAFYLDFERRWRREVDTEPDVGVRDAYMDLLDRRKHGSSQRPATAAGSLRQPLPPNQLPRDVRDFTGHQRLLKDLDRLADPKDSPTGVIVIDGAPGVGKTTLAVHWARRHLDWFPDGQLFLDANAYGATPPVDPDDVLGHFLHSLGVPADRIPANGDDRRNQLSQLLANRRLLVVLDNARDAHQARPLLAATSNCLMLITSRSKLSGLAIRAGLTGVTVPTLTVDESVSLLRNTIGAQRAATATAALDELARMSSGLPLALRIIGHHVVERPRAQLSDLVDQLRSQLLAPDDEFDDEDATIRTVFAWSYRALPERAADLFRLLGLHPGRSISTDAAAALLGDDVRPTERLLDVLARANLVEHDTAWRYRLHDLLRLYAADRADEEETSDQRRAAVRRMLDWYLLSANNAATLVEPRRVPVPGLPPADEITPRSFTTDAEALQWCEAERETIVAAVKCAEQYRFYDHCWQLCGTVHEVFDRFGNQDDLLRTQEIALIAAKAVNNTEAQWGTLNNLGVTHLRLGHYEQAAAYLTTSLGIAQGMPDRALRATCMLNLGIAHMRLGDIRTAISRYRQALREYERAGERLGIAVTHHHMGDACRHLKRHDEALTSYQNALRIHEDIGSLRGQGNTHAEMAALHLELHQYPQALEHCRQALELHTRTKDHTRMCEVLITSAAAHRHLGHLPEANRDAQLAEDLTDEIADSRRRGRALGRLAEIRDEIAVSTP
jgi:DNA-binding SARP family transcriptional activator/tetratricopeptide (TPR) repeat protein